MGISGLFAQIGHGQRVSLAKLSAEHFTAHERPFRLAIDISIWLFQIQAGKGGSNPALRTFYYRLLRLLSLNIHPLFVFDGPNKPQFKRNKKVGGPGIKVATVPEFLAKQLLKHFGFPLHVAPGEAEAECALLQREGIVDAVLSEDVDTLMFGSGVTLRNWTAENTTKTPTHVDVHRAQETKTKSGLDREGMILVGLMSGGDYLPEGIPGCGPKMACDAARAGFGKDLCALGKRDTAGFEAWKERLQLEIRTNESKFFKRRNPSLTIPDDFPSREVLGFYTHPCVSTAEKLARVRQEIRWDQPLDFAELRSFAGDAFDWRCIGGAKKFIKNLAPALLVRELRLRSHDNEQLDLEAQEEKEHDLILAIHGKRNHNTTDGELEYRISFVPEKFVPIDLSLEDEDDEFLVAGGDASDAESDFMQLPSSTQGGGEDDAPGSPKKRNFKPYNPDQPEKLWILRPFLQIGCPFLVEEHESVSKDPKEFLKQRRQARAVGKGSTNIHSTKSKAKKTKAKADNVPTNTMLNYARVTKESGIRQPKESSQASVVKPCAQSRSRESLDAGVLANVSALKMPSTQVPDEFLQSSSAPARGTDTIEVLDFAVDGLPATHAGSLPVPGRPRPFLAFARAPSEGNSRMQERLQSGKTDPQMTPKRKTKKRPPPDFSSPALSQGSIVSYYSPSPRKTKALFTEYEPIVIDLLSSPIASPEVADGLAGTADDHEGLLTPRPSNVRSQLPQISASPPPPDLDYSPGKLPDTVTKRRKKGVLKRWQTEPAFGSDDGNHHDLFESHCTDSDGILRGGISSYDGVVGDGFTLPLETEEYLPSLSSLVRSRRRSDGAEGGFLREDDEDLEATPKSLRRQVTQRVSISRVPSNDVQVNRHSFLARSLIPPVSAAMAKTQPSKAHCTTPILPPPSQSLRNLPHQQGVKKRIHLRESLEGSWKVKTAEAIDMTGDGSGWKRSGGKVRLDGWRKSGVEVLDLTGAS